MTHPVLRAADLTKGVVSGEAPLTILDRVSFAVDGVAQDGWYALDTIEVTK